MKQIESVNTRRENEDTVRGCMLGWYGFTDGGAISDALMKGNPKSNVAKMIANLKKMQALLK